MNKPDASWPSACLIGLYTLGLLAIALWRNDGHFVYALDDPYIHLDLARQIATTGVYGLNPGEYSAPSSSILWPLLLVPFVLLPGFVHTPFVIGFLAAAGSAALITRMLPACFNNTQRIVIGFTGALALNLPALSLVGMEHGLHILLSLLAAYGVLRSLEKQKVPDWLWAIIILLPLVRYEGILVSIAALGCLFWVGQRRQVLLAGLVMLMPLIIFSLFLHAHQLGLVPGSTIIKKLRLGNAGDGFFIFWFKSLMVGLRSPAGIAFVLASFAATVASLANLRNWRSQRWAVLCAITGVLLGHLVLGRLSTFESPRYDQYAIAFVVPLAFWLIRTRLKLMSSALLVAFAVPSLWSSTWGIQPAITSVYQQQYQLQRLVQEYWHENIAVNDIGLVGLGTDAYVLDLVGLANAEVRTARHNLEPDWSNRLVHKYNVPLIAVYRSWHEESLRRHWTPLGELFRTTHSDLGDSSVLLLTPYAHETDNIRAVLRDWAADLPAGARYVEYNSQHPAPPDKP